MCLETRGGLGAITSMRGLSLIAVVVALAFLLSARVSLAASIEGKYDYYNPVS